MTKNRIDIKTISTNRTDKITDRVLLFGLVPEKEEIAITSHFLKFLLASHTGCPSAKQKEQFFAKALITKL